MVQPHAFRRLLVAVVVGMFAMAESALGQAGGRPPNIVVILVDDLGYGDVGCYGATKVRTPNVDRLAKEGLRFTDGHAAGGTGTPSPVLLLRGGDGDPAGGRGADHRSGAADVAVAAPRGGLHDGGGRQVAPRDGDGRPQLE